MWPAFLAKKYADRIEEILMFKLMLNFDDADYSKFFHRAEYDSTKEETFSS